MYMYVHMFVYMYVLCVCVNKCIFMYFVYVYGLFTSLLCYISYTVYFLHLLLKWSLSHLRVE